VVTVYDPHRRLALERLAGGLKLGNSYVKDNKLTDHHAIIPSAKTANAAYIWRSFHLLP
jgi:hypothetical protein